MAHSCIPIELEKGSSQPFLTSSDRNILTQEVERLQSVLWGGRISDSLSESSSTLERIRRRYMIWSHLLSCIENREFVKAYDHMREILTHTHTWSLPPIHSPDDHIAQKRHTFTDDILKRYGSTRIRREYYMKIFELSLQLHGFSQKVRVSGAVTSIYDGREYLEIPESAEYDTISLEYMLCLLIHEIGTHYVNQSISEKNGLTLRGAGNIEKEEWLAIIMEMLVLGQDFSAMQWVGGTYPYMLAGELLTMESRHKFFTWMLKIQNISPTWALMSRDLRIMRGFPFTWGYVQRKDCSYTRGKNHILSLIATGKWNILDFYRGKVGIETIISGEIDSPIHPETISLPFLLPDVIISMLGENTPIINQEWFTRYVRGKYNTVFDPENLKQMTNLTRITGDQWQELRVFTESIQWEYENRYPVQIPS